MITKHVSTGENGFRTHMYNVTRKESGGGVDVWRESSRVHTKYAQGSRMGSFINLKRKYDWATKIQRTIRLTHASKTSCKDSLPTTWRRCAGVASFSRLEMIFNSHVVKQCANKQRQRTHHLVIHPFRHLTTEEGCHPAALDLEGVCDHSFDHVLPNTEISLAHCRPLVKSQVRQVRIPYWRGKYCSFDG